MSDEDARQAVLDRLSARLDAVVDARHAAKKRGDTARYSDLCRLSGTLERQIALESNDPEPLPGREDEAILLGGRHHGMFVTRVPADAREVTVFGCLYRLDASTFGIRPRRFLWAGR